MRSRLLSLALSPISILLACILRVPQESHRKSAVPRRTKRYDDCPLIVGLEAFSTIINETLASHRFVVSEKFESLLTVW